MIGNPLTLQSCSTRLPAATGSIIATQQSRDAISTEGRHSRGKQLCPLDLGGACNRTNHAFTLSPTNPTAAYCVRSGLQLDVGACCGGGHGCQLRRQVPSLAESRMHTSALDASLCLGLQMKAGGRSRCSVSWKQREKRW